jgi:hypothetical protein
MKGGKRQKMTAKKGTMLAENLVKAILFLILAAFVFVFLAKLYNMYKPIPKWARSLSSVENAIENLDEDNLELTRTATVQLEKYFVKGFKENSGMCVDNENEPHCICACTTPECENAKEDKKYCKSIPFNPGDNFVIQKLPDSEGPLAYRIGLEENLDKKELVVLGLIS